jgi:proteasome lid subunit RPN8/RPN11
MTALVRVPAAAVEASLDAIGRIGAGTREVAVFWLSNAASLEVSVVVVPAGRGVHWGPRSIHLDESWMLRLAECCEERELVVLGGVHAHPEAAFMSWIDRDAFFHAPDFVSVVVPAYGRTDITDAFETWVVFAGLPGNRWRPAAWGDDVCVVAGDVTVVDLEGRDGQDA